MRFLRSFLILVALLGGATKALAAYNGTAGAAAAYDTSTPIVGSGSLSNGYVDLPAGAGGAAPTFTWELRFKRAAKPSATQVMLGASTTGASAGYIGISVNGFIIFNVAVGNPTYTGTVNLADGAVHHVSIVGTSSGVTGWVDGAQVWTNANVQTYTTSAPFSIGSLGGSTHPNVWTAGDIDEVAFFNYAKYTTTFTPPTTAYTGSETGLISLYHLDSNTNDSSGVVAPTTAPVNSAAPAVTPTAGTVGTVFSSSTGTWTQTPTSYAYQWYRAGTAISGAASASYTAVSADVGNILYSTVVATNSIGSSSPSQSNSTSAITAAPAATTYAPNNAGIVYSPGNWNLTSSATTVNAGAYFRTLFQGTAPTLNFNVTNNTSPISEIYYRVDGYETQTPWTRANVASTIAMTIPSDTSARTYHFLEVMVKSTSETLNRWTSPSNTAVVFTGLSLTGTSSLTTPAISPKSVLIFGDSITEGVRTVNESATNDTDRNDALISWAYNLGHYLGAEVGVIGFGGQGVTVSNSTATNVPPFQTAYASYYGGAPRAFTPLPSLIVLNQGGNDATKSVAVSTFQAAYTASINSLLSAYPGVPIVVMPTLPPSLSSYKAPTQAAVAACNNPGLVSYVDTTSTFNTAYGADSLSLHPSGPNNLAFLAPGIANALRPYLYPLGTGFPGFRSGFIQ